MSDKGSDLHLAGKEPLEHIKEALVKGKKATEELHGAELSGQLFAFFDAIKSTAVAAALIWVLSLYFSIPLTIIPFFLLGITLWKTVRSALLGWNRLERVHRLIEEERWEIEHHRETEKTELTELYKAKGFSGKLLDDVISVLMADENRLLQEMLQEELGVPLEKMEHPLKQALGAFYGSLLSFIAFSFSLFFVSTAIPFAAFSLFTIAVLFQAVREKNDLGKAIFWHVGAFLLTLFSLYFLLSFWQTL